jgi:hypothetical protein
VVCLPSHPPPASSNLLLTDLLLTYVVLKTASR